MFQHKPIIGIVGGIGSGKTFVARAFGELGCVFIDSDELVHRAYEDPAIQQEIRNVWGAAVFDSQGQVNRSALGKLVFADPTQRTRLEAILHPYIARLRDQIMEDAADQPQVPAFIWDAPLLIEAGLSSQCDAVVFVDAPLELRIARVAQSRGWDSAELLKREKLQLPLDKKKEIADYVIDNTADADIIRRQVRDVFPRILQGSGRKVSGDEFPND
ncbi:MAG: dephospho-CoA kinase [Tepidisphaeraceae bacterium]